MRRSWLVASWLLLSAGAARADNPDGPQLANRDAQAQTVRLTKGERSWTVKLRHGKRVPLDCDSFSLGAQTLKVDPESTYWIEDSKVQRTVVAR